MSLHSAPPFAARGAARRLPRWSALLLSVVVVTSLAGCELVGSADEPGGEGAAPGVDASGGESGLDAGGTTSPPLPAPTYEDPYAGQAAGATPRFEPSDMSFGAYPFPSNRRLHGGRVDLEGFPDPFSIPLVQLFLDAVEDAVDGFSPNQVIWFGFDEPLGGLPALTPVDSTSDASPVWLIDADPASPRYGERHPVELRLVGHASKYIPEHTLAIRPVPGAPLQEGGTYAAVVRRSFGDGSGAILGVPDRLRAYLLDEADASDPALDADLGPLRQLAADGLLNPYEVAVGCSITVGHPTAELERWREVIWSRPAPAPGQWRTLAGGPGYALVEMTYEAPAFQRGDKPYTSEGGGLVLGPDGAPEVLGTETIRAAVALPLGEPPPTGWPVVLYGHGTGGDYLTFTKAGPQNPAQRLTEAGMAVIGIDQPLHGARAVGPGDLELLSFNFLNPEAGRTNFRQSAADFIVLAQVAAQGITVPATVAPGGAALTLDPDNVAFMGHSHGGLGGAMLAAVEPTLKGYVLSGAGGGLTQTIMLRKEPYDFLELVALFVGDSPLAISELHPVLGLMQMAVDATDPLNYAPLWRGGEARGGTPMSLFMTLGHTDTATPAVTAEALAAAGRCVPIAPAVSVPPVMDWFGVGPRSKPMKGNWTAANGEPATGALWQHAQFGHFLIFQHQATADALVRFLSTALQGEAVVE